MKTSQSPQSPLAFLNNLKKEPPPVVTHVIGEDRYIAETIRRRVAEVWRQDDASLEMLVGIEGAGRILSAFEADSFFTSRKVIVVTDAGGEKASPLSKMGKKQQAAFVEALAQAPAETARIVIESGGNISKPTQFQTSLKGLALEVDATPPREGDRRKWISLMARKSGVTLDGQLEHAMLISSCSLSVLAADMEKLALACDPEESAHVELWTRLTQAEPEAKIWDLTDALAMGSPDKAFLALHDLKSMGNDLYALVPAVLSWNRQRLQVRKFEDAGQSGTPEGMHPFVHKKMKESLRKASMDQLRQEQQRLFYLDRSLKQSWEDPEMYFDKLIAQTALRNRK